MTVVFYLDCVVVVRDGKIIAWHRRGYGTYACAGVVTQPQR